MRYLFHILITLLLVADCLAIEVIRGSGGGGGPSVVLGRDSLTDTYSTSYAAAGEIRCNRVQADATGSVSLFDYYGYTPGNWIGAIYSDVGTEPTTLLAQTASNSGPGYEWAWDSNVPLDVSLSITTGTWYWNCVQISTDADMQYKAAQTGAVKSYTTTYGSLPTTWPSASDTDLNEVYGGAVMYAH